MKRGFTLLEILLAIAIMTILMGIVIAAINPARQLAQSRDAQRRNDVGEIQKAINQYYIDHKEYPAKPADDSFVYELCNTRVTTTGYDCGVRMDLSKIVPTYLSSVPTDPIVPATLPRSGYNIALSRSSGIYVEAANTEVGVGASSTVIFVGRPPVGYIVPSVNSSGVRPSDAISRINIIFEHIVVKLPNWSTPVLIFLVGFIVGLLFNVLLFGKRRKIEHKMIDPVTGQPIE